MIRVEYPYNSLQLRLNQLESIIPCTLCLKSVSPSKTREDKSPKTREDSCIVPTQRRNIGVFIVIRFFAK